MSNKRITEVAEEAVKIYFDYKVSAREAIEKAKEVYQNDLSREGSRKS